MTVTFVFQAGDHDGDPDHVLHEDGAEPFVAVQDARSYVGGYVVNEYGPNIRELEWVRDHGVFRTLAAAKRKALEIHRARYPAPAERRDAR